MDDPVRYTLGFAFYNHSMIGRGVFLIRKGTDHGPELVRGKLNGLGGKMLEHETPAEGMSREFLEESGALVIADNWNQFCTFHGKWGTVYCYRTELGTDDFNSVMKGYESITSEHVSFNIVEHTKLHDLAPRVNWLIHLALDEDVINSRVRIE